MLTNGEIDSDTFIFDRERYSLGGAHEPMSTDEFKRSLFRTGDTRDAITQSYAGLEWGKI